MSEKKYFETLLSLPADLNKAELIITEGADAGSRALVADGRIAACTGSAQAREFFARTVTESPGAGGSEDTGGLLQAADADPASDGPEDTRFLSEAGTSGSVRFQGTGEIIREGRTVFYEQLKKTPRLVICGAGHAGLAICRVAAVTGLETIVIDDRPGYACQAREAGADHVICAPFEEALAGVKSDLRTCFVLVTRGHAHGMECLRTVLRKQHLYAGMMSSRRRADAVGETLLREGFSPGEVRSVHMPVGLEIGAETPGEIAVSVMAQIIKVIRGQGAGDGYPPEILDAMKTLLGNRRAGLPAFAVLATIVKKSGEAPREPGTRMLVLPDGSIRGSVGGGYAEAEIVKAAGQMLRDAAASPSFIRVEMPLAGNTEADALHSGPAQSGGIVKDEGMLCGGQITVLLERILP